MAKSSRKREDLIATDLYKAKGAMLTVSDLMDFTGQGRKFVMRNIVNDIQPVTQSKTRTMYYFRDVAAKLAQPVQ